MFTDVILKIVGIAFGVGLLTMLMIALITMPVSYMMNKFIYHHWMMRVVLGILAGVGSIFTFAFMIYLRVTGNKIHYFGFFPTVESAGSSSEYSGYFASVFRVIDYILHPFLMFYENAEDVAGYAASIDHVLAKKEQATVNEKLFEDARKAGTIDSISAWKLSVGGALSDDFKRVFAAA